MTQFLFNFAAFQACWFANVLGAAGGLPWLGPLLTAMWLAAHLRALGSGAAVEGWVLLGAALLGWLADSGLVLAGLVSFPEASRLGGPSPLWMLALWLGFAATLRHALGWLRGRYLAGAVLGAVGGPLAYLAGDALGAIRLDRAVALAVVAAQFAVATPALLALARVAERAAAGRGAREACP